MRGVPLAAPCYHEFVDGLRTPNGNVTAGGCPAGSWPRPQELAIGQRRGWGRKVFPRAPCPPEPTVRHQALLTRDDAALEGSTTATRGALVGWLIALAALALCTALFLREGLTGWPEREYTSADLTQDYSLDNLGLRHRPGNRSLSDPVVQMLPWLEFSRSEIAQGRVPLWNPYNGGGAPHLGNAQSAVLSPFSLPFYFGPRSVALLLSAALKLLALGLLTYGFLRELELAPLAAIGGAIAFAFCGHNTLLVAYPHAAAACAFPALLWAIERACKRFRAGGLPATRACLLGASAAVLLGVLAGHPEPLGFALVLGALFAAWRTIELGSMRLALALAAAIALGLALGAPQILPFAEYALHSTLAGERVQGHRGLYGETWPLTFFPDLLGNPALRYKLASNLPRPNYEAANTVYVGALVVCAAAWGALCSFRERRARIFALLTIVWLALAYDWLGAQSLLDWIPGSSQLPLNRSQAFGAFCASVLFAMVVDSGLRQSISRPWLWSLLVTGICGGAFLIFDAGASDLVHEKSAGFPDRLQAIELLLPAHLHWIGWTLAAGALCLAALPWLPWKSARHGAALALAALVFLQGGWVMRTYNTCSPAEMVYPLTESKAALRRELGADTLLVIGTNGMPPQTNAVHGIRQLASYDALWIAPFDELYRIAFEAWGNWREALLGSEKALQLFGARYVLTQGDWIAIDPLLRAFDTPTKSGLKALPLADGMRAEQDLRCEAQGMDCVALALSATPGKPVCELRLTLSERDTGKVVHESRLNSHTFLGSLYPGMRTIYPTELRLGVPGRLEILEFPAQSDSLGRDYRLSVEALGGVSGEGFVLWSSTELAPQCGPLRVDGVEQPERRLWFNAAANRRHFERVVELGHQRLWRYKRSLGSAWLVHEVSTAPDVASMLGVTLAPGVDPATCVVLPEGWKPAPSSGTPSPIDRVEVLRDVPGAMDISVSNGAAGHLVLARPWYPGWRATIDGKPAELLRANYAFQALAVPPGEHRIELEYAPWSWRAGLAISAIAALIASYRARALFSR